MNQSNKSVLAKSVLVSFFMFIFSSCQSQRTVDNILNSDNLFFKNKDIEKLLKEFDYSNFDKDKQESSLYKLVLLVSDELESRLINEFDGSYHKYGRNDTSKLNKVSTDYLMIFDPFTIYQNGSSQRNSKVDLYDVTSSMDEFRFANNIGILLTNHPANPKKIDFDANNKLCRCYWPFNHQNIMDNILGSGFLYDNKYFITTAHSIIGKKKAEELQVVFNFSIQVDSLQTRMFEKGFYVYKNNANLDFAIFKLKEEVKTDSDIEIDYQTINDVKSDSIYMLGYPLGLPLKLTNNAKVYDVDLNQYILFTNLDAFNNNSGSPVFGLNDKLIGILRGGNTDVSDLDKKKVCIETQSNCKNKREEGNYPFVCNEEVCYENSELKKVVSVYQFKEYIENLDSIFSEIKDGVIVEKQ